MPNARTKHPSARDLADFGLGKLPRDVADAVAAHLAACGECQERLAEQQPDSFVARLRAARPKGSTALPGARRPPPLPAETVRTSPAARRGTEAASDVPPELAGLSKFQFLEKLGEGGMGAVWKARHAFLGSVVAVKVMNDLALGDDDARHRFLREMRAAGKLDHPNIVRAHDAEQAGDLLYLVMEYVEGLSLDKLVAQRGPLPIGLACRCAAQAAEGLRHAHERGMVHRDIKPGNLMVTKDGTVKVLDFGLARLCDDEAGDRRTRLQVFMGTADFVSPEQALNARGADVRSDIYSLGCTLYVLLAGGPPFVGETAHEVAAAHLTEEPPPLDGIPEALWAVIARMLAKDREERYQAPAEVIEALRPFASRSDSAVVAALPPPLPPPLPARRRWPRPLVSVGLASAAALALVLSVLLLLPARDRRQQASRPDEFVPLFNGRDLDGWEAHPDSTAEWKVEDGLLVCEGGGPSLLFTRRDDFENVTVRARVRLREGGNSGLFVRKAFNPLVNQGYQAEVFTDPDGNRRTGGIVVAGNYLALPMDPPPVGDWTDLEFTVQGYSLKTKVNGRTTASCLDPARRYPRGRIAVELGPDQSRVEFSKVEALELPSEPQLLKNPGCEAELVEGKVPGWEVVEGEWTSRAANPAPHEGKAYFFAGECPRGELQQVVDLSRYAREADDGRLGVTFEGYVATYPQRKSDTSQVVIDYLDAGKAHLTSFTSAEVASETGWQKVADSRVVPKGTRWARVRLISVRHDGKNNDGYFDGLWLKADVVAP
ncbi:MAG: protein kinase [Gemmataceae bacterium]